MNYFIKNSHINELFHLKDLDIPIADEKYPHLIITGKNGSGKTVLLNAVADWLERIRTSESFEFPVTKDSAILGKRIGKMIEYSRYVNDTTFSYASLGCEISSIRYVIDRSKEKEFIIAFYQSLRANSELKLKEPKSPTKPKLNKKGGVKKTYTDEFLNFMSDLKIQEALARNEKQIQDADDINSWFVDFEKLLQQIYQDDALKLEFNYKDYSFRICTEGKKFKFTELSDGFAAVLDIVADLILKMQDDKSLTRAYQKEGIVLIDEIETHLHLGLQKVIMPLLTRVFPNIQFIITTHSPFILSSMPNAVAYDLEHREVLDDLTEYSYESLAEGYFGVRTQSSYAEMQLETLRNLLEKEEWTDSDKVEIRQLKSDFEKIPETVSPLVVGGFRQMMIQYADKLKSL
jgi:predicted ATPase